MTKSSCGNKNIIFLNLTRHPDLLNISEYLFGISKKKGWFSESSIVTCLRQYDGRAINYRVINNVRGLFVYLYKASPDWVYVTGPSLLGLFALSFQRFVFRKMSCVHLHRFDYNSYGRIRGLFLRCYNYFVTSISTLCIVHSEAHASINRKYHYAPLPFYNAKKKSTNSETRGNLKILFFGRIDSYKGVERVLELAKVMEDAQFFVYGEIVDRRLLKVVSKLRSLPNCHVFASRVRDDQLPEVFADKDVLLLPYYDGTQSGVPNLAASYGVPVLATNFGSVKDVIAETNCGICLDFSLMSWQQILRSTDWLSASANINIDHGAIESAYANILQKLSQKITTYSRIP